LSDRTVGGESKTPIRRRALSPAQAYELAVARHRAGRLGDAEQLYRAVLKVEPDHVGALHYLGLACAQGGKFDEAVTLLRQAVALDENSAEGHNNLGLALAALKHPEEAMAHYQRAIALQPDHAEARNNFGIVLQGLQRHAEAAAQFERVVALRPDNAFMHVNFGNTLAALGRNAEAAALFAEAIELNPRLAEAHNGLGQALAALDRDEEAVANYQQAVALKPDYTQAFGNLGAALNKLKRHEEAIVPFKRTIELDPTLAEAHADIGNALAALERYEEATGRYLRALELKPDFVEAHYNLGNALIARQRYELAITHFEAALAIDPTAYETRVRFAKGLTLVDRHDEAIAQCQAALALRPESAEVHWHLGNALEGAGRSEEAIDRHRQALAIEPAFAWAHNALGTSLITLGRIAEGRKAIERAIELSPTEAEFHRNLAMARRFVPGDSRLQAMEELGRNPSLRESQRMTLQFALGKAYADLGRREDALHHLIEANAIKRGKIKYDEKAALAQLDRIKEVFTRDLMRRKAGHGAPSDVPVFILGMPRSGSTLIEQILASHPDVFGAGELGTLGEMVVLFCRSTTPPTRFTEIVVDMPPERLGELGARYVDSVRALAPKATRITDKSLLNYRMAGLIHLALPGARIIHSRRDPLDNCLSCFEREFARDNQPFTYDLAELGRYYRTYDALMAHWREVLPEGVMLDVQYEELVGDFESQARRIVAHCGLDWDERCRAFHKTERPVKTASVTQVREPLYRSSVGRWQGVAHLLKPLLDELVSLGKVNPHGEEALVQRRLEP
jgi:tetratricopeptide (TPR) repeat protein